MSISYISLFLHTSCLQDLSRFLILSINRVWKCMWTFCSGSCGYCVRFFSLPDSWILMYLSFHIEVVSSFFLFCVLLCSSFSWCTLWETPSLSAQAGRGTEEHSGEKCACGGHLGIDELHLCLHFLIHSKHIN